VACRQTCGISTDWLLCADLKAFQRMMQAPGQGSRDAEREVCPPVGIGSGRSSAKRWMNFWRITNEPPAPIAPEAQQARLAAHAARRRRMFTLYRRSVAVEMWISGANLQHTAGMRGLRPRASSRICVPHNQYVSVHVAAPARSRHVANALIAASVLSMIQPSRTNHCAKISLRFE